MKIAVAITSAASAVLLAVTGHAAPTRLEGVPRYEHIFVIVDENKDYGRILGGADAPNISRLAKTYGNAGKFFGETHPSEANYIALLGGDTLGIHDDDPFFCKPGSTDRQCVEANSQPGYPDHTSRLPHIGDQLATAGLTWKAYLEDLPAPGSLAYIANAETFSDGTRKTALYASKHVGFVNFASTQIAADRAKHLVGFNQLDRDAASGKLPNFALIVPNQCNDMHGLHAQGVPADCDSLSLAALIRRGDAEIGRRVRQIQATTEWRSAQNVAIIITFDEGPASALEGCCAAAHGGGHIPTVVITNHGVRGVKDDTPYNHYSLLRTIEDAFGIDRHLGHAADTGNGVVPMVQLFDTSVPTPKAR